MKPRVIEMKNKWGEKKYSPTKYPAMPVHISHIMKKKNSMNERINEVFFREDEEVLFLRPIETGTLTRMGGDGG